jgi:hypothetical protein
MYLVVDPVGRARRHALGDRTARVPVVSDDNNIGVFCTRCWAIEHPDLSPPARLTPGVCLEHANDSTGRFYRGELTQFERNYMRRALRGTIGWAALAVGLLLAAAALAWSMLAR